MPVIPSQDASEYRNSLGKPSSKSQFGPELGQFLLESDFDFLSNMMATTSGDAGTDYGFHNEHSHEQRQGLDGVQRQPSTGYAEKVTAF